MFDELVEIICNYVDVQPADVHEESRFMEELGFTSFDFAYCKLRVFCSLEHDFAQVIVHILKLLS